MNSPSFTRLRCVAFLLPLGAAGALSGQTLTYWDGAMETPNGVVDGGSGTWNTTATNWTDELGLVNSAYAADSVAVFSGAAGAVDLTESISSGGMRFLTDGYVVNGGSGAVVTFGSGAEIQVAASVNAALTITAQGTNGFTKTGAGELTLSLTNGGGNFGGILNFQEGITTMVGAMPGWANSPVLNIGANAILQHAYNNDGLYNSTTLNGDGVSSSNGLYVKGGTTFQTNTLTISGAATTIRSYDTGTGVIMGFDTQGPSMNVLAAASGSVSEATVNYDTRWYGYRFGVAAGANTATGDLIVKGKTQGGASLIKSGDGSLYMQGGLGHSGGTVVNGGLLRLTNYGGSNGTAAIDFVVNSGGSLEFASSYFNSNLMGFRAITAEVNQGGTMILSSEHALGGDYYDWGTSFGLVKLNGGKLTANAGQYISGGQTAGTGRLVLQGATVDGTGYLRSVDYVAEDASSRITVLASDTTSTISSALRVRGNLFLDVADGGAGVDLRISGAITPETTANGNLGALIKNGAGTLETTSRIAANGGVIVNAGHLKMTNYSGGTGPAAKDFVVNSGGSLEFATSYWNGSPFGYKTLSIDVNEGGSMTITNAWALGSDNLDYGTSWGQVSLNGGALHLNNLHYLPGGTVNGQGRLLLNGGTVDGTGTFRTLDYNSESSSSRISSVANAESSVISVGIAQRGQLYVQVEDGAAQSDLILSGGISDMDAFANGIIKSGQGNLVFSGADKAYRGATQVREGMLTVNAALTATPSITLSDNTTLSGTGSAGAATLFGSGIVAPGNSPGTLTVSAADLSGGMDFKFEFTETGSVLDGAANDALVLTAIDFFNGTSATADNVIDFYFADGFEVHDTMQGGFITEGDFAALIEDATFRYFEQDALGSELYNGVSYSAVAGLNPFIWSSVETGDGRYILSFTVIPEPARGAFACAAFLAFAVRRKRSV